MDIQIIKNWIAGYGDGSGYGDGYTLKIHNGHEVFYIDNLPTVILSIHNNYAKGYVVNRDFSISTCFIAKSNCYFAHGDTLRHAVSALSKKSWESMTDEEKIEEFCETFDKNKSYRGALFFDWHNRLTGSCLFGRQQFVKENDLSLDKKYTVKEFIDLTRNAYGGSTIQKLEKYYSEANNE